MRNLFSLSELDLSQVDGVVISSVVPAVDQPLTAMAERYFRRQPMFVNAVDRHRASKFSTTIRAKWARTAWSTRSPASISTAARASMVDLGTTINFDMVSKDAEFLGGVICARHRHVDHRTVCPHRPPAHGGFPRARKTDRVSNTVGSITVRPVLRIHRHDRRHRRAHRGPARTRHQGHRHRRAGAVDRRRLAAS